METKAEILELFDRLRPARSACFLAQEALANFERQPAPKRPTQVEDLDDYLSYAEDYNRWLAEKDQLERELAVVQKRWQELETLTIRILPPQVWFRHGEVGIGIAYSNWGGSNFHVQIEPWEKEMRSLNHVHHGD